MNNDRTEFVNQNMSLSDLDKLYLELGKAYYEGGFEDPLPQLLPLFDQITRVKKQNCPQCGNALQSNARFCGKCGYQVK